MSVPALLKERWRTGQLTGEAKHACVVRIRKGRMERGYLDDQKLDGTVMRYPQIWEGVNFHCWKARWTPLGDWITLPNISSVSWGRSFTDKSAATCTILMDDVAFVEETGVAGMYHDIVRGYFSPMRGDRTLSRPDRWSSTSWKDVLNGGYQVEVWEGYGTGSEVEPGGDAIAKTFTGLIEQCDLDTHPDHITITARDFTLLLTDQRMFRYNKAKEVRGPVTFADRKGALGERIVFGNAKTSSGTATSDPRTGVDWESTAQTSDDATEWVEIDLPAGHYEEFLIQAREAGMELYAAVHAGSGSFQNDQDPNPTALPNDWVDLGNGNVPGTSIPWVTRVHRFNDDPHRFKIGRGAAHVDGFWFAHGSRLRVFLTNLPELRGSGKFFAGVRSFYAFRHRITHIDRLSGLPRATKVINRRHWVLVEDAADVVRMILIWAGFREFYVEDFGWSLHKPIHYGEDKFHMDVIDELLQQGNFVFHMTPPTDEDESIGVPRFERQKATSLQRGSLVEVRDTDMTEALTVTWDLSEIPNIIRYRGRPDRSGRTFEGDVTRRYMGSYYPPWSHHYVPLNQDPGFWFNAQRALSSRVSTDRDAALLRQFSQTVGNVSSMALDSDEECSFACLLSAIQFALRMVTGSFQIPGLPGFTLNEHVSIVEEATGVNSRLWIGSIQSNHTLGDTGSWHMTIGGSLIDIADLYLITSDYQWAHKKMLTHRPPSDHRRQSIPSDAGAADVRAISPHYDTG